MKTGLLCVLLIFYSLLPINSQNEQAYIPYYTCTLKEFLQIESLYTPINIIHPDYGLLDAAIFHLTNQSRTEQNIPPFRYFDALHKAAQLHSTLMIDLNFCAHYNSINLYYYFPLDRVREFDKAIPLISENIAEYPLIKSTPVYCLEKQKEGNWVFYACKTRELLQPYAYLEFAKMVVGKWMDSPPHRKNILSEDYQYLGCAARFSKNPFKDRKLPFARLTQNFGGYVK
jgi:uncharacterized protein YkwD